MKIVIDVPVPIPIHLSRLQAVRDGLALIVENCDEEAREDAEFMLNKIIQQIDEKLAWVGMRKVLIEDEQKQRTEEKEIKDRLRKLPSSGIARLDEQ